MVYIGERDRITRTIQAAEAVVGDKYGKSTVEEAAKQFGVDPANVKSQVEWINRTPQQYNSGGNTSPKNASVIYRTSQNTPVYGRSPLSPTQPTSGMNPTSVNSQLLEGANQTENETLQSYYLRRSGFTVKEEGGRTTAVKDGRKIIIEGGEVAADIPESATAGNLNRINKQRKNTVSNNKLQVTGFEQRVTALQDRDEAFFNSDGFKRIQDTADVMTSVLPLPYESPTRQVIAGTLTNIMSSPIAFGGLLPSIGGKLSAAAEGYYNSAESRRNTKKEFKNSFSKVEQGSFSFLPGGTPINVEGATTITTAALFAFLDTGMRMKARTRKIAEIPKKATIEGEIRAPLNERITVKGNVLVDKTINPPLMEPGTPDVTFLQKPGVGRAVSRITAKNFKGTIVADATGESAGFFLKKIYGKEYTTTISKNVKGQTTANVYYPTGKLKGSFPVDDVNMFKITEQVGFTDVTKEIVKGEVSKETGRGTFGAKSVKAVKGSQEINVIYETRSTFYREAKPKTYDVLQISDINNLNQGPVYMDVKIPKVEFVDYPVPPRVSGVNIEGVTLTESFRASLSAVDQQRVVTTFKGTISKTNTNPFVGVKLQPIIGKKGQLLASVGETAYIQRAAIVQGQTFNVNVPVISGSGTPSPLALPIRLNSQNPSIKPISNNGQTPNVKSKDKTFPMPIVYYDNSQVSSPAVKNEVSVRNESEIIQNNITASFSKIKSKSETETKTETKTQTETKTEQVQKLFQEQTTTSKPTPINKFDVFEIPPYGIPVVAPIFGKLKNKSYQKQQNRPIRRNTAYTPSLAAVILNVKGKSSSFGITTGLGIRPLQVSPPKKKKKRGGFNEFF